MADDTLLDEAGPYVSRDAAHQGLLLHSIYHRPNGWDHVPAGSTIPRGESSMWGDYHLREAALYVKRLAEGSTYYTFFGPSPSSKSMQPPPSGESVQAPPSRESMQPPPSGESMQSPPSGQRPSGTGRGGGAPRQAKK